MPAREPTNLPAINPGKCEWCGDSVPQGRKYCCPQHRTKYNNWLAAKGKVIMQAVLIWAKYRGAKDKPEEDGLPAKRRASGMLGVIRDAADDFNRETRERIAEWQKEFEND